MSRLISCATCGKIHPAGQCKRPRPPRYSKNQTGESGFRSLAKWTAKSLRIRERDNYLCQACLYGLSGTKRITTEHLEVHHIVPIADAWDDRLNDDNLITLCREHHEMAEQGKIDRDALRLIARKNREQTDSERA